MLLTFKAMTIEQQRQPLKVLSSSRVNQLSSRNLLHEEKNEKLQLPSITSIIEGKPTLISTKDGLVRSSARKHKTFPLPISPVTSCAVATGSPQVLCESLRQQPSTAEYEELARRLRVRLQFAYYKYKTNQTHLKFRQLHRKVSNTSRSTGIGISTNNTSTSARRLVGSRGHYRTPVKHATWRSRDASSNAVPTPQQNTPMSVKAAKSLLQLFASVP